MLPTTINHAVILKDPVFSGPRCGDSYLIGAPMIGADNHLHKYGDTVIRVDKIQVGEIVVGYVYVTADYDWFFQGLKVAPSLYKYLFSIYPYSEQTYSKNPSLRPLIEAGGAIVKVPSNYKPPGIIERVRCVAADLRGHV